MLNIYGFKGKTSRTFVKAIKNSTLGQTQKILMATRNHIQQRAAKPRTQKRRIDQKSHVTEREKEVVIRIQLKIEPSD